MSPPGAASSRVPPKSFRPEPGTLAIHSLGKPLNTGKTGLVVGLPARERSAAGGLHPTPRPGYGVGMDKQQPERDDVALTRNEPESDPLGEVYSEMVTPDIAKMNEHAERLAKEAAPEPDL